MVEDELTGAVDSAAVTPCRVIGKFAFTHDKTCTVGTDAGTVGCGRSKRAVAHGKIAHFHICCGLEVDATHISDSLYFRQTDHFVEVFVVSAEKAHCFGYINLSGNFIAAFGNIDGVADTGGINCILNRAERSRFGAVAGSTRCHVGVTVVDVGILIGEFCLNGDVVGRHGAEVVGVGAMVVVIDIETPNPDVVNAAPGRHLLPLP